MDLQMIIGLINKHYPLKFDRITLLRDGPGFTCTAFCGERKYVVKIYRSNYLESGKQSVEIMSYLSAKGYPVPSIILTKGDQPFFIFDTDEGRRMGVIFDFIDGIDPNEMIIAEKIGRQVGDMHNLMQDYFGNLVSQSKPYFIDFYLTKLNEMDYPAKKTERFAEYGNLLWSKVENLPRGFCHGDLHTGNIILTASGDYVILDFDLSSLSFPAFDMMTICDVTHYFHLRKDGYEKVTRMIHEFSNGYAKSRHISEKEINSVYDLISVRHYQLQAQIIDLYGLSCVDEAFIDRQYEWLMNWREQCEKRRA